MYFCRKNPNSLDFTIMKNTTNIEFCEKTKKAGKLPAFYSYDLKLILKFVSTKVSSDTSLESNHNHNYR